MLYIYHHIFPTKRGMVIKEEQKKRIYEKINTEFTYIESINSIDKNEWETIIKLYNEAKNYKDNDIILYIHTKGAVNDYLYNAEWRDCMETELIDNHLFYLDKIKMGFDTAGCLMGIPDWSQNFYGGNFWYISCEYLKRIPYDEKWDFKNRHLVETNFIQRGENWKPYNNPLVDVQKYPTFYEIIYQETHWKFKRSRIKLS